MGRETEAEGFAIRELASLFKITHSYLWDDAMVAMPEIPSVPISHLDGSIEELNGFGEPASLATIDSDIEPTIPGLMVSTEDTELAKQMNELGLPVSFSTNKERRLITTKEKRKGPWAKSVSSCQHVKNRLAEVSTVSEQDGVVPPVICKDNATTSVCSAETNGHSGSLHHCFAEDSDVGWFLSGEGHCEEQVSSKDVIGEKMKYCVDHDNIPDDIVSENDARVIPSVTLTPDAVTTFNVADHTEARKVPFDNGNEQTLIFDAVDSSETLVSCLGDWMTVWDDFYMRNYYYNIKTNESTWNPPPGMEHLAYSESADNLSGTNADSAERDGVRIDGMYGLENSIALIQEVKDPDNLSSWPSQLITTGMEHATGNTSSSLAASITNDKHANFDEPLGNTVSSDDLKIATNELYVVPFHLSSEIHNSINSIPNIVNPSGPEEFSRSVEQQGFLNPKADESCNLNDLDKPGGGGTCKQTDKLPDDSLIKLPEAESLTCTFITECYAANSGQPGRNNMQFAYSTSTSTALDSHYDLVAVKKKKKVRKQSQGKVLSYDNEGHALQVTLEGFSSATLKYWYQRYLLFSRFDDGVKTDEEGWFSITPEAIARHHASRCGSGTVIDCFTGVGGNAIQFAMRSKHVIAIDIDPKKIDYAQHNAVIYGVNEKIDFIKGDFLKLASKLKADTLFMSPPWGGPDYSKVQIFDISTMLKPCDGCSLFKIAMRIAPRVVMFLPRNVDLNQLAELSLLAHPPWELEVEKNYLNGKLKAVTAYFNEVLL